MNKDECITSIRHQAELQGYKKFPWIKEEGHPDGYHENCFCNFVEDFIQGAQFILNNKNNLIAYKNDS